MPDAYATVAQYRGRNPGDSTEDDVLGEVLEASARYIDRRLGWAAGALAPIASRTVRFWPQRVSDVLRLRDGEGAAWPLRAWTAIAADYSGTGTANYTWDATDAWIVGSSSDDRPFRSLRMLYSHDDAVESVWPSHPGWVDITGEYGWADTPGAVRELNVHAARAVLDSHTAGAAAVMAALETGVPMAGDGERLWRRVEMEYSAGRMGRLGAVAGPRRRLR